MLIAMSDNSNSCNNSNNVIKRFQEKELIYRKMIVTVT